MKKILIIEDNKLLGDLLKDKIISSGYDVLVVENGQVGIQSISDYNPDLILLDMMMPDMDGFSVLEKMKEEGLIEKNPVIIISNSGQPVEIERALALGIKDYIVKVDFEPAEVLEKIEKVFGIIGDENNIPILETEELIIEDLQEEKIDDDVLISELNSESKKEKDENAGVKILLVEDDEFLRGICEHKLKKEGFDVSVSVDGQDALEKIMSEDFQLILLDVILPNMNGFEILEKIKQDPEKAKITVIMLTNMGQESEVKKGFDLGVDDYIIKAHFTVEDIIEKVKEVIVKKNIIKKDNI